MSHPPARTDATELAGHQQAELHVIEVHGWAHGGEAVGRLADGRACFVAGALPGEVVEVRVTKLHKRHATAELVGVVTASPHRVEPPCPYYGSCGGCQLQHASPAHQLELKTRVLVEQLQRIGKVAEPPVSPVTAPDGGWPDGYRAWARMAVDDAGRLGFRRRGSHEVQPVDRCLLLTPEAQALRDALGDGWAGAAEVTLTAGAAGAVVQVDGAPAAVPDGDFGVVVHGTEVRGPAAVEVEVRGVPLRASAGAFFQAGAAGAGALVDAVLDAVGDVAGRRVADLYAGGGLLSAFLARAGASVVAVEADDASAADARANLADLDVEVRHETVEAALDDLDPVDVVVLDPPRTGARAEVCRGVAALSPSRVVYVACDPAALARDVATFADLGYALRSVVGLDLFGHTAHVEAVAVLDPADPA